MLLLCFCIKDVGRTLVAFLSVQVTSFEDFGLETSTDATARSLSSGTMPTALEQSLLASLKSEQFSTLSSSGAQNSTGKDARGGMFQVMTAQGQETLRCIATPSACKPGRLCRQG